MRRIRFLLSLVAVVVLASGLGSPAVGRAGEAGAADQVKVRAAARRGLALLETEGVAWIGEKKCISCHHVPFLVWAHQSAARRGVEVDPKKLGEWTDWTLAKSLSLRVWFRLSDEALGKLKEDGVPEEFVGKLKPLVGQGFATEAELAVAVAKASSAEESAKHGAAVAKRAALSRTFNLNDGGAVNTLALFALGRVAQNTKRDQAAAFPDALRDTILRWQEPTGLWTAENQFKALQRSEAEAHESTTLWALWSLAEPRPDGAPRDEATAKAIDRGLAALKGAPAPKSNETVMARLMVERRLGSADKAAALRADLLGRQNQDGGWGWAAGAKSDALATGEAMFLLIADGVGPNDPAIARAAERLLATQEADGGWPSPMSGISDRNTEDWVKRCNPIFRYWGNGWAVLGLLETLPEK